MGFKHWLSDHLAKTLPKGIPQKVHEMILREPNSLKLKHKKHQKNNNLYYESPHL